jgi:hypothetical protein
MNIKINIPAVAIQGATTDFSNAPMKMAASFLLSIMSRMGYGEQAIIKSALESGGAGLVPLIALSDDVVVFLEESTHSGSLSNATTLACIGSEIAFDIYELAASISQVSGFDSIQNICEGISSGAMSAKVLGSLPLAILTADRAYSEIFERSTLLGSEPSAKSSLNSKLSATLRASETGLAAVSNLALYYEGSSGSVYAATSIGSNIFKGLRATHNWLTT